MANDPAERGQAKFKCPTSFFGELRTTTFRWSHPPSSRLRMDAAEWHSVGYGKMNVKCLNDKAVENQGALRCRILGFFGGIDAGCEIGLELPPCDSTDGPAKVKKSIWNCRLIF